MNFANVKNLVWVNSEHTMFDCVVDFEGLGAVPFSCSVSDDTPHAQQIWAQATAGEFGEIAEYQEPQQDANITTAPSLGSIPSSVL